MKRRTFLRNGSLLSGGLWLANSPLVAAFPPKKEDLYTLFQNPPAIYRPFVRWWWNGDKVNRDELIRELRLMKEAGIGGVEINPVKFPTRTDDMGTPSVRWLSNEWIDLLKATFDEAEKLGLTCDLIVGSGWPFGAEYLQGEERSQILTITTRKLEGPLEYEASLFDLCKEGDPAITSPYTGRQPEVMQLKLVPNPLSSVDQIQDLSSQIKSGKVVVNIPKGKHVLYALVKTHGFMEVINGAPGADGPVLNHYDAAAVKKYLNRMTDAIEGRLGPLKKHVRALFTDSMELEGANWSADLMAEFRKRRGYDLVPYLPFLLFKIGAMGNIWDFNYTAEMTGEFKDMIERMRYDFALTQTELLEERFVSYFTQWCREHGLQSRIQAYGRGYDPLEGSFKVDLPECETWIKYGLGKEMSGEDYRIGRAYTMANKYLSSAAHLKGKKYVSAEELTNTDMVFNDTLEILKIGGDQSTISGVTHPIFHGFNYSPPDAPFPGWVRYGTYFNEKNTWWPYFRHFTDYKARISAVLQQATMFADIAVLPPVPDTWSLYGNQNEPFPGLIHPNYQSLVWESIHQNGNACDYVSEGVIRDSVVKNGQLTYGPRAYHTLVLINIERTEPDTLKKIHAFVQAGGRVFCVETIPTKSLGWHNRQQRDAEVAAWVSKLQAFPDRFIRVPKPEKAFTPWFTGIQKQYGIQPYLKLSQPDPFVTQIRYQTADADLILLINSNMDKPVSLDLSFSDSITAKKTGWIWDAVTGERFRLPAQKTLSLDLGPADCRLFVFDKTSKGTDWKPLPLTGSGELRPGRWELEFRHIDGSVKKGALDSLVDLKDRPDWVSFAGSVLYRTEVDVTDPAKPLFLNLGKVYGVSELAVNGQPAGVQWYGRRVFPLAGKLKAGRNTLEIKVATSMGNYMKTLTDNAVAQYWTNTGRKNQPIQSMGILGPVTLYS
ncbi:glycosyl hydrolase [Siphonobacter aquaeclarae]|uniref:Alpha-L-rhamnosidase n=1 Tax=Siphonobacter aquaeclarae TaxID=563176 RepID=A0A1G9IS08_9BACT|nr:glycosyl hydrolase [Siphonobacter aquaeclarae]SDL27654.1 hypothetical protein SAMN04488090_0587 [Siphonobacter aquaeclarae]